MRAEDIELPAVMSRAGPQEAAQVAAITADSFRYDPFNRWLFGNFESMALAFGGLARTLYARRGYCYWHGNEGAAMWMLPGGGSSLPLAALPTLAKVALKSSRGGLRRRWHTVQAMEAHHPKFDHAYLFTVGVRPAAQGKGLGGQIIRPVLEACDRAGVPAYLENSNPANSGFYAGHGFERVEMIHPLPGSPPLEAMIRRPRS